MIKQQRGFTLLEVLLAVAIFALVSAASVTMMQRSMTLHKAMTETSAELVTMQRLYRLMSTDIAQFINRPIRDSYGAPLPAMLQDDSGWGLAIAWTKTGRSNAIKQPRSNLQRVRYWYDGENIMRRTWQRLDRAVDSVYAEQVLLADVAVWKWRFLVGNKWTDSLPKQLDTTQLQAMEVTIGQDEERLFRWIFSLNGVAQPWVR